MTNRTVLIAGGTSDVGYAIAKAYAMHGWRIVLTARDLAAGERNAHDIAARYGVPVDLQAFDIIDVDAYAPLLDRIGALPDTVISVVGALGDQKRAEADPVYATTILRANFGGPALFLGAVAQRMEARGTGTIVGIGSVAGDRGRASNYVYGAGKAGFAAFLSGLRNRLSDKGVHVLTVKPGFMRTRMTAGMKLPSALTADPDEAGRVIYRAAEESKRNVIYVRPIWRIVMAVICLLPEFVFKKTRLG